MRDPTPPARITTATSAAAVGVARRADPPRRASDGDGDGSRARATSASQALATQSSRATERIIMNQMIASPCGKELQARSP